MPLPIYPDAQAGLPTKPANQLSTVAEAINAANRVYAAVEDLADTLLGVYPNPPTASQGPTTVTSGLLNEARDAADKSIERSRDAMSAIERILNATK